MRKLGRARLFKNHPAVPRCMARFNLQEDTPKFPGWISVPRFRFGWDTWNRCMGVIRSPWVPRLASSERPRTRPYGGGAEGLPGPARGMAS